MRWIMGLFLVIAAVPVSAQQAPRPTEVGEEALNDLIRRGLEAGGLVRAPDPESDHPALAPGDAARLRAAVAADRAALTPELRDLLIARVAGADPSQRPAFLALLRSLGEVTQDVNRSLADCNWREKFVLCLVVLVILGMGIYPRPFLRRMDQTVSAVLERVEPSAAQFAFRRCATRTEPAR